MGNALIRAAGLGDVPAITAIYAHYVRETIVSFEVDPPDEDEMRRRMAAVVGRYPYLVVEEDGTLSGYAYADAFNARAAYRWISETTIYLKPAATGRGLGQALYQSLLDALRTRGFLAAMGKISLPNGASVALHEAVGFARVGVLDKVGYKFDAWHDVGIWQAELSPRVRTPVEPNYGLMR